MGEHVTSVRFSRAFQEYVPECSCGWVGSYLLQEADAERDAAAHEQKEASGE